MVSLDPVVVPDLVEKKKKKNKKRKADEVGDDTLVKPDVGNDIPEEESKPKKKKKNKDKVGATEVAGAVADEEIKKLKKKKKKTTESGEGEVEEEEDNFDVDSGVFKKKFYTPDETTQAMTKVFDKLCSHLKHSPCHFSRLR